MIYITGDTHRDFKRIVLFCYKYNTSKEDILIILGDAGINYYGKLDNELKEHLNSLPITLFCIHGNHENRPENILTYQQKQFLGGQVYVEEKYSSIIFAKDGETYNFGNIKVLVIGGAYSVDKYYRIAHDCNWWQDEQPSKKVKQKILDKIQTNNTFDIVLTHTCPYKYIPREVFLPGINQSTVDNSTEHFLDKVEKRLNYKKWYCGHYHTNKKIDKLEFLFEDIKELNKQD